MTGIYKITNQINGKSYIGQSINIDKRIKEHFWKATCEKDKSFNSILHIAIRKYGAEQFIWEVLEECSVDIIDEREKYYIEKYNTISPNGYNILSGGQKVRAIPIYCKECGKQITKEAITGLCHSCYSKSTRKVEWPTKEELVTLLKTNSFEAVGRMYNVSSNAIRRWCKRNDLPYHIDDYRIKKEIIKQPVVKKAVQQINIKTGEIVNTFSSQEEAARALGKKTGSHISEVCRGIHKTAYGFYWRYI